MEGRRFITPDEAIKLLGDAKEIHTFRSGSMMLIGADRSRESVIDALRSNPQSIEIGGEQCRAMGHGLVVDSGGPLFIEVDKDVLNAFDPVKEEAA